MHVISVNLGEVRLLGNAKATGKTGIFKQPAPDSVHITAKGLAGDAICDRKNHGGPDQAVYVYGQPDYDWWSQELGTTLAPGTFGENLTLSDLVSAELAIGDHLHVGEVTLQVTAPRIPCVTLARRMEDPAFVKRYRAAERPGLYCRVLREGRVQAGDAATLEPFAGERVLVIDMFRDFFAPERTEAAIQRFLQAPIAIRARKEKEKELRELLAAS